MRVGAVNEGTGNRRQGTGNTRAVFLDRDGVINEDTGYVSRPEDFLFLPGVIDALAEIQRLGYSLVIVTNQSGIGRGQYTGADYERVTRHMLAGLASGGIKIAAVRHCPHAPEAGCRCRKPAPGMILDAQRVHDLDLAQSWLVGDKSSDIEAAHRAGIHKTLRIKSPYADDPAHAQPLFVGDSLAAIIPQLRAEAAGGPGK